ncbi:MAG: DNA methyltransferase [Chloroflexota bacterium]
MKLLCPQDGLVLDPFSGSGTTGIAALSVDQSCLLIDNNLEYCDEAVKRIKKEIGAVIEGKKTVRRGVSYLQTRLLRESRPEKYPAFKETPNRKTPLLRRGAFYGGEGGI